jgi:hypothetical protein
LDFKEKLAKWSLTLFLLEIIKLVTCTSTAYEEKGKSVCEVTLFQRGKPAFFAEPLGHSMV